MPDSNERFDEDHQTPWGSLLMRSPRLRESQVSVQSFVPSFAKEYMANPLAPMLPFFDLPFETAIRNALSNRDRRFE